MTAPCRVHEATISPLDTAIDLDHVLHRISTSRKALITVVSYLLAAHRGTQPAHRLVYASDGPQSVS